MIVGPSPHIPSVSVPRGPRRRVVFFLAFSAVLLLVGVLPAPSSVGLDSGTGQFEQEAQAGLSTAQAPAAVIELTIDTAAVGYAPTGWPRGGYDGAQFQRDLNAITAVGISGGVLGMVDLGDRRLAGRSGMADTATRRAVPLDGFFRIGSNTKTFIAVVLLQLVQEGRVGLDDSVGRWLPGVVSGNGNDGRAITVRELMQHTSGLYNYTDTLLQPYDTARYHAHRFDHHTPEDLVAIAMAQPPLFAPGTRWSYSNTNYILLGMVIRKVTGRYWYQEVQARILTPLHLTHTGYPGDWPGLPDPHAVGYSQFEPGEPLVDTTLFNATFADSAGSLVSTAADLTRFWQAIQRGELLEPAQMAQMHNTVPADRWRSNLPDPRYGLGIQWLPLSCGGGYWRHGGNVPGYTTMNGVSADGRRSVVLSLSTEMDSADGYNQALALVDHVMCSPDR
jgi:D-alanyl-D-alanine carboxypeptidase